MLCEKQLQFIWMLLIIYDEWMQFPPVRRYGTSTLYLNNYHYLLLMMTGIKVSWWYFIRVLRVSHYNTTSAIVTVTWPRSQHCSVTQLSIEHQKDGVSTVFSYLAKDLSSEDSFVWLMGSESFNIRMDLETRTHEYECSVPIEIMEKLGYSSHSIKTSRARKERILHKYRFVNFVKRIKFE